ncbi:hypothetical protein QNI16_21505 [Cytophagaceae bacterium YF14B1]|uniref:Lipoprotein n=1 Tax=Xanthocytophaga flava TaxID=3048013 RepID=A0AAE3QPW7_9BACT|nr:hypothetical protein [Xanthocytophaga flavus]MDJ1483090.1 hypothetical protein [Xanthocytophaga flavus]
MVRHILLLVVIGLTLFSCHRESDSIKTSVQNEFKIRVKNQTPYQFENVLIRFGGNENTYGILEPAQISEYKIFTEVGFPYIKVSFGDKEQVFQIMQTEESPSNGTDTKMKDQTCVIYLTEFNTIDLYFQQ